MPLLMIRPASRCYVFDMEHIKFVCFQDKCMIFNIEDDAAQTFLACLEKKFNGTRSHTSGEPHHEDEMDFEHVILESAFEHVTQKFKQHVNDIQRSLYCFLEQVELDPESNGLRKILAVKKNLKKFLQKVQHVKNVLQNISAEDDEMSGLYLSQDKNRRDFSKIELLLNTYTLVLESVVSELKVSLEMIENTYQFIGAHMDSIRNGIIKMSLFMEMGCIVMAFGAFVTGIFGMNLTHSLQENSHVFLSVVFALSLAMIGSFAWLVRTYGTVLVNKNGHNSFRDLNDTFKYVDDLAYQVPIKRSKKDTATDYSITTQEEFEFLY